jgi:hypothetical protein
MNSTKNREGPSWVRRFLHNLQAGYCRISMPCLAN